MIILWASSLMMRPWNQTCVLWITERQTSFPQCLRVFFIYQPCLSKTYQTPNPTNIQTELNTQKFRHSLYKEVNFVFVCGLKWDYLCSERMCAGGWDCPGHSYAGSVSMEERAHRQHLPQVSNIANKILFPAASLDFHLKWCVFKLKQAERFIQS